VVGNARDVDYYTDKGMTLRKSLMKTPINGAVISSPYGKRKHPILGYTKLHKGVDFAAPRGTPFYAAGDGVIEFIGRNGGYGNYIRIRHGAEYKTAYGHIQKFAKGMKKGRRVRQGQIIAYVGTTGRSTGPHLHYEILKNNKHINPMKVKIPARKHLAGMQLSKFNAARMIILLQL
jgi:murein DD-endopeptidase MepM/ murein hydrolase activator NlpD